MPMIIDATTGLPAYSFFENAVDETLAELMAEAGDPETELPVREPGEPLADPEEPEDDDEEEGDEDPEGTEDDEKDEDDPEEAAEDDTKEAG